VLSMGREPIWHIRCSLVDKYIPWKNLLRIVISVGKGVPYKTDILAKAQKNVAGEKSVKNVHFLLYPLKYISIAILL
jgi:hypothetical protein